MAAQFFTEAEARDLARRTLAFSTADQARVNINSGSEGNTRFAVNQITTAGDVHNASIVVTSAFGKRVASATTNRFDDESLQRVVETSERLARLVPENPEYMGELEPQSYTPVSALAASTVKLAPTERARAITLVTDPAQRRNLVATGFLTHAAGSTAVANSKGLFAYNAASNVTFTNTVRTPDGTGSGWAGAASHDWTDLDIAAAGARAMDKAERSTNARAVEPGRWTVILEPTAVANML